MFNWRTFKMFCRKVGYTPAAFDPKEYLTFFKKVTDNSDVEVADLNDGEFECQFAMLDGVSAFDPLYCLLFKWYYIDKDNRKVDVVVAIWQRSSGAFCAEMHEHGAEGRDEGYFWTVARSSRKHNTVYGGFEEYR